jgi:glycosyltransferase involved in cell wall biosynthesis
MAGRLLASGGFSAAALKQALKGKDVVVSNTITNGDLLPEIRKYFSGPVFSYIHELKMAAELFTSKENIRALIANTDHYLVPCQTVKEFLVGELQVPAGRIDILPYYIPMASTGPNAPVTGEGNGPFVIGGAGTTDWRKGIELFLVVAQQVFAKMPEADIRFAWKGALPESLEVARLQYDIQRSGLEGKIRFLPLSREMDSYFSHIDLFLLTSREDPYPLVVLEAAGFGKPTLAFEKAGGAPEFIGEEAGSCYPYLDTTAMADGILHYYRNRAEWRKKGEQARERVRQRHQQPGEIRAIFERIATTVINRCS